MLSHEELLEGDFVKGQLILQVVSETYLRWHQGFELQIRAAPAYSRLVDAGVNGAMLLDTCTMFHFFDAARPIIKPCLSIPPRGRPTTHLSLLQFCCDAMVREQTGAPFYRELCELAGIVFQGRDANFSASPRAVDDYCRSTQRARKYFRADAEWIRTAVYKQQVASLQRFCDAINRSPQPPAPSPAPRPSRNGFGLRPQPPPTGSTARIGRHS